MTQTDTTAANPAKAPKVQTVIDDMTQRRVFDTAEEATAYIGKCQTDFVDFSGYPVAAAGFTEDGDFDAEIYNDDMRVAVSVLSQRANSQQNPTNVARVHCIAIYPMPKLSAILGADAEALTNTAGLAWLNSAIETELNHIAVRNLRKTTSAQEIAEAVESMPTTLADFITSGRESTGGILETYNELWQIIKKGIGEKSKPFALANLSKKELRKAMESASYAATGYPQLESRKGKDGSPQSLFVMAATFGQILAKDQSLDSTIFDRMIANRNEKTIEVEDDEADFDFESMAAKLTAKPADNAEPAPAEEPAE